MTTAVTPETIARRFWARVDKRGPVVREDLGACWVWTGATRSGYGAFSIRRDTIGAHIVSWELANGRTVPAGLYVLHACDNRPCVNPSHLSADTQAENMADMTRKGRRRAPMGAVNGMAKLDRLAVLAIFDSPRTAEARRHLRERHGVSQPTLTAIYKGTRWSHLTGAGQENAR